MNVRERSLTMSKGRSSLKIWGTSATRRFTLDGDTLTLRFTSTTDGGDVTRTLVFRRPNATI